MTKYINCHTEDKFFSRERSKILSEENVVGKENMFPCLQISLSVPEFITRIPHMYGKKKTYQWTVHILVAISLKV